MPSRRKTGWEDLLHQIARLIKKLWWGRLGCLVGEVSAFGSGHDPRVLGWSPTSGSLLSRQSASPSAPPLLLLSLSLTLHTLSSK